MFKGFVTTHIIICVAASHPFANESTEKSSPTNGLQYFFITIPLLFEYSLRLAPSYLGVAAVSSILLSPLL